MGVGVVRLDRRVDDVLDRLWAALTPTAPVVRRGDVVAIVAGGPGYRISIAAIAEADAAPGARVRLRNRATGERLQGELRDDGEIWLAGF